MRGWVTRGTGSNVQDGVERDPWVHVGLPGSGRGAQADLSRVLDLHGDLRAAIDWAVAVGRNDVLDGPVRHRWELLASVAAIDPTVARVLEPHLDALGIIAEAGGIDGGAVNADEGSSWGVYAAEGPGRRLDATPLSDDAPDAGGTWLLSGTKPWCSLAADLSHALVTAYTSSGRRRLFAVDLRSAGVQAAPGPWVSRGLASVVSAPVAFDSVPAVPVGADGWYLDRPGFAWGGAGVAACWWGAAVGIARHVYSASLDRTDDPIGAAHLGAVDLAVSSGGAVLGEAAGMVGSATRETARLTAHRVRGVVADACESVLAHAAHALGPGPLTTDERYAARTADLQVYLRQHHAERDHASLGTRLLDSGVAPW